MKKNSSAGMRRNVLHQAHLSVLAAALLAACGGGGPGTGIGPLIGGNTGVSPPGGEPAAASLASGTITGFGSVIVNGVRFDDAAAKITLDDDTRSAGNADLKLGMVVEVEGEKNAGGTTGNAKSISGRSFAQGPVAAISAASSQFTVLGLVVTVTPETVYAGTGLLALGNLAVGDSVEVYGLPDGASGLKATRIERIPKGREARLIGAVQGAAADRFTLYGVTTVTYPQLRQSGIAEGTLVRVKGTLSNDAAVIAASSVRPIAYVPAVKEGQLLELEGIVTAFTSANEFEVNGMKVRLAPDAKREGSAAPGARVEVEGVMRGTVLLASKIETGDGRQAGEDRNEVHGRIASIDLATSSFTLRSGTVTVKWQGSSVFDASLPFGAASLAVGVPVEVKGKVTGNTLVASRIKLDR